MSDLVGSPEDQFSHVTAHIILCVTCSELTSQVAPVHYIYFSILFVYHTGYPEMQLGTTDTDKINIRQLYSNTCLGAFFEGSFPICGKYNYITYC